MEPRDPWLMCGPDTSVRELWRAVERVGAELRFHLVFEDRYGWYCEHGRTCPAVGEVRKVVREMAAAARGRQQEQTARQRARTGR